MIVQLLLASGLVFLAGTAFAESTGSVLSEFGLPGTWSPDCAKDMNVMCNPLDVAAREACGDRTIYRVPLFGQPTMTFVNNYPNQPKSTSEIMHAEMITTQKLTIVYHVNGEPIGTKKWAFMPKDGEIWERVLQKIGDNYKIIDAQRTDGKKYSAIEGYNAWPSGNFNQNEIPKTWMKTAQPTPIMEKCLN